MTLFSVYWLDFLPHSVPKGKASLWAENCPNFSFFLFGPGQAPTLGPEKLPQGKVFQGNLVSTFAIP
jgi:hypothetical protein